jgi:hypothetical protein
MKSMDKTRPKSAVDSIRLNILYIGRGCDFFDFFLFLPHPTGMFLALPQDRHPERSASQIYRLRERLQRVVEGPRGCLLADALQSFPATKTQREIKKSRPPSAADLSRRAVEGSAVLSVVITLVGLPPHHNHSQSLRRHFQRKSPATLRLRQRSLKPLHIPQLSWLLLAHPGKPAHPSCRKPPADPLVSQL